MTKLWQKIRHQNSLCLLNVIVHETEFSVASKMSNFVPEKGGFVHHTLITLFHLKKTASESKRLLVEAYGDHTLSISACERWFKRFKSSDFDEKEMERLSQQIYYIVLLDEDSTQTETQLAFALGVTKQQFPIDYKLWERSKKKKNGCQPYQLKERDIERRRNIEELKNWPDGFLASKDDKCIGMESINCQKDGKKSTNDGQYFNY